MKNTYMRIVIISLGIMIMQACDFKKGTEMLNRKVTYDELKSEVESLKKELPIDIEDTDLKFSDVNLDKDKLTLEYLIDEEKFNALGIHKASAKSDIFYAKVIRDIDEDFKDMLIDAQVGLKLIFLDTDTKKELWTIKISAKKFKKICSDNEDGTQSDITILDELEDEFKHTELPQKISDVLTWKKGYVKDKHIYYEYQFNTFVDPGKIDEDFHEEAKKDIIKEMADTEMWKRRQELIEENASIVFIYLNNDDTELTRIYITPSDFYDE